LVRGGQKKGKNGNPSSDDGRHEGRTKATRGRSVGQKKRGWNVLGEEYHSQTEKHIFPVPHHGWDKKQGQR